MKKSNHTPLKKRHDIYSPLITCGKNTPKPLMPPVTGIASRTLRNLAINHQHPDHLLSRIIRRWNILRNEYKVLCSVFFQVLCHILCLFVFRNTPLTRLQYPPPYAGLSVQSTFCSLALLFDESP
jgi:hypothetical protein